MSDTISRYDIIYRFDTQVANNINPTWSRTNVPSWADANEFGSKPSTYTSDISSSNPITASDVVSNLSYLCRRFTTVRNCRRILTNTITGDTNRVDTIADETQLSAMSSNYIQYVGTVYLYSVVEGRLISPIDMSDLYYKWNQLKNNTVTLTYNTHTEHVNHSSRSRR